MSVTVRPDGNLQFNAQWTLATKGPRYPAAYKPSDVGNKNVYVMDNLGNRYDILELGALAGRETGGVNSGFPNPVGWYLVPPARAGSQVFTFHIDDSGVVISGIVLASHN